MGICWYIQSLRNFMLQLAEHLEGLEYVHLS
jgi:hypothetical protein